MRLLAHYPTPTFQRYLIVAFAASISLLLHLPGTHADTKVDKQTDSETELAAQLQPLIDSHRGDVAVAVRHLTQNVAFDYRSKQPMPTASLIKFPLLVAAYQEIETGRISLDDKITLGESDKVPGSGLLTQHFSEGVVLPFRDVLRLMIAYSDNTATNLTIDHVGLPKTAELMESLGCNETKLNSKTYRRDTSIFPERSTAYGLGSTTAADMVKLLAMLERGELISTRASKEIKAILAACEDHTKIARFLPPGTKVANKTGEVSAARTDAALIETPSGPIAICVLTSKNEDQRWGDDNPAHLLSANIGKIIYEHFHQTQTDIAEDRPKTLAVGSTGPAVEALQRTLNARSNPSPGLAVDGDFGPATLAAVKAFQQSQGLNATGTMTAETWQALGPLVAEKEIAAPESINAQPIRKSPPDPLDGPPAVTCKSWVIGDAISGDLLWHQAGNEIMHPASTTKIMTGYLIAELAHRQPEILDEIVTFSERADQTIGSTSGIRAGENVPVGELLYGLLLPSGNDASVALAEHFGPRLAPSATGDNYAKFVAAMNAMAVQIGMENTSYTNTHGLTDDKHLTSPVDLFRLSRQAMMLPLFAKTVATPVRGATVTGEEGYQRNVKWVNTNRLLNTEGYDGIKTGTTTAAGSCLVSQSTRAGRSLIIVVLGSAASDSRYADSRNLYRYAWNELARP